MIDEINIKGDGQTVSLALAQFEIEADICRQAGFPMLKVLHGYGSHGVGGEIKRNLHLRLAQMQRQGKIAGFIPCEKWLASPLRDKAIKLNSSLLADKDVNTQNCGQTLVLFRLK